MTPADLILREALALDERRWDDWLALFTEDCVFWVPTWRSEDELTTDPEHEISFLYHHSRSGLAERIARLQTGTSIVTLPLARTAHIVGAPVVEQNGDDVLATSSFTTHLFHPASGKSSLTFGRYEHTLRRQGEGWCIARKKIILANDRIPAVLEYFCL